MDAKFQQIQRELAALEREERVAILLAVESGSRAWGFPSQDSDYDVRFIYCHRPEVYLSIVDHRDVIERPLHDEIDLCGWDIRKALRLFRKSNPPLLEWLQCPIVYHKRSTLCERLMQLLPETYSPKASFHHYLHMAEGNYREYLRGDTVWLKKYFYVLRPILAMKWIEQGHGPVSIEFRAMLDRVLPEGEVRAVIDQLLQEKLQGNELSMGPRIDTISSFVEFELPRLASLSGAQEAHVASIEVLDGLFRSTLAEVWT